MSSSYLRSTQREVCKYPLTRVLLTIFCCSGTASAADVYFQPKVRAQTEYNTNRNVSTISKFEESIPGYCANLQGTWGLGPQR